MSVEKSSIDTIGLKKPAPLFPPMREKGNAKTNGDSLAFAFPRLPYLPHASIDWFIGFSVSFVIG